MKRRTSPLSASRLAIVSVGLALGLMATTAEPAAARGRHHHGGGRHHVATRSGGSTGAYRAANFSAIVIDANTGKTLYDVDSGGLRHPASITKVMTLYLLFEKLENGEMSLSTQIPVSRHAAAQKPTKLGLRPGSTISVENAIKAIVTRSANDMAVAVAEAVGGDEDTFARMMTRKAHALGMSRTTYVNASGLPDDRQITTARDLTLLGRAVQDQFPTYYRFFSTPSFTYAGQVITTHNHLMERVEGMDGIKTGYTNASGFNLLSNVRRDGHHIVAVVMGGKSAAGRDRIMEGLIAGHLEEAAPTRTVASIQDRSTESPAATPEEVADTSDDKGDAPHDVSPGPAPAPGPSLIAPTLAVPAPPRPVARPRVAEAEKPRPAFVAGATRALETDRLPPPLSSAERKRVVQDGSTNSRASGEGSTAVALATATPSSLRWTPGPQPVPRPNLSASSSKSAAAAKKQVALNDDDETGSTRKPPVEAREGRNSRQAEEPSPHKGGWVIQIGATDSATAASSLLTRAKTESRVVLSSARPMTEKVQKGGSTLYRARFAGLSPDEAETACKQLKRSGFACFATHD